jgi:hypothetical protein
MKKARMALVGKERRQQGVFIFSFGLLTFALSKIDVMPTLPPHGT